MYRTNIIKNIEQIQPAKGLRRLFSILFFLKKRYRKWKIKRNHFVIKHGGLYDSRPVFRNLRWYAGLFTNKCYLCKEIFSSDTHETNCAMCYDDSICHNCHFNKFGVNI